MEGKKHGMLSKYDDKTKTFGRKILLLILNELRPIFSDSRFPRIIWLSIIDLSCLLVLFNWCYSTKSLGLRSFTYLVVFDTLSLAICTLRIWVEQKKANQQFTFGYERFEVLAIFLSATFSLVSSIFLIKKCIERWFYPTPVLIEPFTSGIVLAFVCHMVMTYYIKNKGLNLVVCAASSSLLQQRLTSVSQSFCTNVPGLSTKVSLRFNPFVLIGWAGCVILILTQFVIDVYAYNSADSFAAIFIASLICYIMYPICKYSAKILLQSTPPHIADLLNKCLREASTFDGVLEFRNEHFWLLGYDKIVGSVHVRVRRDANEQVVLSHLMGKLSSLVSDLTIQVFKDEWAWSSSTQQILNESFKKFPPASSFPNKTSSLKPSNVNEKTPLREYISVALPNDYSKPSNVSSVTDAVSATPYKPPYSSPATVPATVPSRLSQSDSFSVDVSGIEPSNLATSPTRYSHPASLSRISRTDYDTVDHSRTTIIDPLYSKTTDFVKPYRS